MCRRIFFVGCSVNNKYHVISQVSLIQAPEASRWWSRISSSYQNSESPFSIKVGHHKQEERCIQQSHKKFGHDFRPEIVETKIKFSDQRTWRDDSEEKFKRSKFVHFVERERLLVVMGYNLISVLESHRIMGIGDSQIEHGSFLKSWPKLLTFKCERAIKIINIMKKLKKIKSQILFHTFLHELILGTWWPDPSISLFWGTLIICKNATRGQFSLYFWLNPTDGIYKREKNLPWNDIL